MTMKEFLGLFAVSLFITAIVVSIVVGVSKYFDGLTPSIQETTLTDGTKCAVNRNGGIACNWINDK